MSKSAKISRRPTRPGLDPERLKKIHLWMLKARLLEERLIKMYKQSDGYFWLGGPGEEAFNVPLAMHLKKGEGLDHDYLHMHYRGGAIMLVYGMDPADSMRQLKNTASDPFSGGRNFVSHFSARKWNVVPVTSTIETQYLSAIGTGIAQMRHGGTGLTLATGGDAGSAEGDFESCLIWSSRPGNELPMLIVVTNNAWGISTAASTQHGEKNVSDRGKPYGIKTMVIDGNDVEESWFAVKEATEYVRKTRKPCILEARVSRLYGHSSATGANWIDERDCLAEFEKKLEANKILTRKKMDELRETITAEYLALAKQVREEPLPDPSTIYDFTYAEQKGKYF